MQTVLQCRSLTKIYAPNRGAQDIDLEIGAGEIVGFLGPNGAGKTTTIRMLMGLLRPDSGELEVLGNPLRNFADFPGIYEHIGFLPSDAAYYPELTGLEMFKFAQKMNGSGSISKQKIAEYAERMKLDLTQRISRLSFGNKRKVGIILSLISNPRLIILDEPTAGLDPLIQRAVLDILHERAAAGAAIFLSSHNLAEVEDLCDRVVVIKESKVVFSGTIREIKSQKQKKLEVLVKTPDQLECIIKKTAGVLQDQLGEYATLYITDLSLAAQVLVEEKIQDFTVENLTLEEMFINYYK